MGTQETALISVIIPVYNVEKYLTRCVESVAAQTYKNLEIWLIDDGSTDGCGEICDRFAERDERIKVIHKGNGGASDARNAALDRMNGSFVTFVDADDFIHRDMILKLYNGLVENSADMAASGIINGTDEAFDRGFIASIGKAYRLSGDSRFEFLFSKKHRTTASAACGKLYRAGLFLNLRFPAGKNYEDEFTIHHILNKCSVIIILEDLLYYHYSRDGSVTRSSYSLKSLDAVDAIEDRCAFFDAYGNERLVFLCYRDYLRRVQFHYYSLMKYFPGEKERTEAILDNYRRRYNAVKNKMGLPERFRYGLFLRTPALNKLLKSLAGARRI